MIAGHCPSAWFSVVQQCIHHHRPDKGPHVTLIVCSTLTSSNLSVGCEQHLLQGIQTIAQITMMGYYWARRSNTSIFTWVDVLGCSRILPGPPVSSSVALLPVAVSQLKNPIRLFTANPLIGQILRCLFHQLDASVREAPTIHHLVDTGPTCMCDASWFLCKLHRESLCECTSFCHRVPLLVDSS